MAIHVRVSPTYDGNATFYYQTRYFMDLSPTFIAAKLSTQEDVEKLVGAMKKLPQKSHDIHSRWVLSYLHERSGYLRNVNANEERAYRAVVNYFT